MMPHNLPPTKSAPSFGPTFPDSNPLSLLDGKYNLSESLTSLPAKEFEVLMQSITNTKKHFRLTIHYRFYNHMN